MERKLKVLLIVGKSQSFRIFDAFEPLTDIWEIEAASFLADLRKPSFLTQIPLQTFIEDPHLPGYMRGVEEAISRADIIIASGCTDQASFQALRYCEANDKPLLIFISDGVSLRQNLDGDTSGLADILSKATTFIVSDSLAAEQLNFLGVDETRIVSIAPRVASGRLGFQPQLRKKFREYIGIKDEQFLILCSDPLENYNRGTGLLMAVKYLIQRELIGTESVRVLFTGSGPAKEQLKYLAVDSGIAGQVLFIGQDTSSFLRDLYCAADLGVSLSKGYRSTVVAESANFWVLEGLACGLRPLFDIQHHFAGNFGSEFVAPVENFEALGLSLLKSFKQRDEASFSRKAMAALCITHFDSAESKQILAKLATEILQGTGHNEPGDLSFPEVMQQLNKAWGQVPLDELFGTIDGALMLWERRPEEKGRLQLFKAQVQLRAGHLEAAMSGFEYCTADEALQRDAYLGLGRIAYLTCAYDEAQSFYRKSLAIKPNDAEAMMGLGYVFRKSGRADDAVYWLGKSITIDIENNTLLMALTQACLECDDLARAIAVLEQLRLILGEKPALIMALGQLYYQIGQVEIGHILVQQALTSSQERQDATEPKTKSLSSKAS